MKTLEMVRLKVLINFSFLISSFFCAQESKPFYSVNGSININNPVVIGIKGYYNLFITDKNNITNDLNINKLLEQGKAFLYNDDTTFSDIVTEENKQQLGNCNDMSKSYSIKNKYVVFNLPKEITHFYLGFTSFIEYDKRMQNPHQKAYMKITGQYYPILFPICKN